MSCNNTAVCSELESHFDTDDSISAVYFCFRYVYLRRKFSPNLKTIRPSVTDLLTTFAANEFHDLKWVNVIVDLLTIGVKNVRFGIKRHEHVLNFKTLHEINHGLLPDSKSCLTDLKKGGNRIRFRTTRRRPTCIATKYRPNYTEREKYFFIISYLQISIFKTCF